MKSRKYIDDAFKKAGNKLGELGKTAFFNDERRRLALMDTIDRATREFATLRLASLDDALIRFEIACISNFRTLDDQFNYTLGATIWVLDVLRKSGKLGEAYQFLPSSRMDIEEVFTPVDFYHPCYEDDLIQSVAHVLYTRNVARGAREQFDGLISLLPEEKVTEAIERFKALQWKAVERFLQCTEYFDRNSVRLEQEIKKINEPSVLMIKQEDPEDRAYELAKQGVELEEDRKRLEVQFEDYLGTHERKILNRRELGKILGDFQIEDPFEICFAANYLAALMEGSIWSTKSAIAVLSAAGRRLPWYENAEDWDEDFDPWEPMSFTRDNGWLEKTSAEQDLAKLYAVGKDGKNLAQRVYKLCKGMAPIGFHPFETERAEMKETGDENADLIADQAEILFLSAFHATAANFRGKNWWEEDADEAVEADNEPEEEQTPVKLSGYWGRIAGAKQEDASPLFGEEPEEEPEQKPDAELEKAKREIKNLKKALSEISREAADDKAKLEHELKGLRLEHRELADLRSLVFNKENEVREKVKEKIDYPYSVKKRTVVFGGHDSFLRAIKPMLDGVKFVDTEQYGFDPDIVRNADVVWIQTNCISHSQYGNIVKVTRPAGIQLRYFGFASAEKCAEQLVMEDQRG